MSTSSITSSPSYSNPAGHEESVKSSSQQQPGKLPATDTQITEDTVDLSQLAQIQQMAQLGESASSIASSTGLTVNEVDSDLGISTTSSSVPVAAPIGHGGEHPTAAAPTTAAPPAAATAPAVTSHSKPATPAPTFSVTA
jgi:hypothetical protein